MYGQLEVRAKLPDGLGTWPTIWMMSTDFYVYAMEWSLLRIDMFIDDTPYFSYINDHQMWQSWPYDKPFHLILNIAVGGGWGGAKGVAEHIWSKQILVDYVRFYQH